MAMSAKDWSAREAYKVASMTVLPEGFKMTITPQRWIPVEERLPEQGVPVIGWFPGATQSFECSLNEHDGVWCEYGTGIHLYDDERPTHWMPFPPGPPEVT